MKAKEVLKLLNIYRVTLCKYMKEGLLKGVKMPTDQ
jgi:predicted site-specific integrase-resolvase